VPSGYATDHGRVGDGGIGDASTVAIFVRNKTTLRSVKERYTTRAITLVENRITRPIKLRPVEEVHMASFDARPIIAAGDEPFDQIMAAVGALEPDEEFVVLAPFEPVPLEGVLGAQGFSYEALDIGGGDWQVTFRRPS
jgi:uncharacterized protein (DUF2249 family)